MHLGVAREAIVPVRPRQQELAQRPAPANYVTASTRTPLRALAPKTTQRRGFDCSWDREFLQIHQREGSGPHRIPLLAAAVARVIAVANGEEPRPQPVLQMNGVSIEEAIQPTNQPTNQGRAENRPPCSVDTTLSRGTATELHEREVVNLCLLPSKASSVKRSSMKVFSGLPMRTMKVGSPNAMWLRTFVQRGMRNAMVASGAERP